MNGTKLLRPDSTPPWSGLAIALVLGCAGPGSLRLETPAPTPDDEVSMGYGTQAKKNTTGAITSVSPSDADARVPRLEEMLLARVPGLEVVPLAGGSYTLRIRGQRGLRATVADDQPLLVIDDLPVSIGSLGNALAGLSPRDVARIDVLKDAGSTAIYGSRGANGVIIITTKRAR